MAGISDAPYVQKLAVPAVTLLIAFLGYTSQYLFHAAAEDLKPGPLTGTEFLVFNTLLLCLWWSYYKTCTVDPGRYVFTSRVLEVPDHADGGSSNNIGGGVDEIAKGSENAGTMASANPTARWCRKCCAPKPSRAHHCRTCRRCVPKMDHHCPWTANCVSLTTLPHFLRFLLFANLGLWHLSAQLFARFAGIWQDRHLPAYLGPSLPALIHLSLLAIVDFFTCVALGIMFGTTVKGWLFNMTMIEGWEAEKHEERLRSRSRSKRKGAKTDAQGAWWEDGSQARIDKVEFPYDIGFFANMSQAMGSSNPLAWVLPWAGNPQVAETEGKGTGWEWEENGFNARTGMWPPADPDRAARGGGAKAKWPGAMRDGSVPDLPQYGSREEEVEAFRRRQEADMKRWQGDRSRIMAELEEVDDYDMVDDGETSGDSDDPGDDNEDHEKVRGVAGDWTNSDGERLRDYGVDEEAEDDVAAVQTIDAADEDVPLAELVRGRKNRRKDGQGGDE